MRAQSFFVQSVTMVTLLSFLSHCAPVDATGAEALSATSALIPVAPAASADDYSWARRVVPLLYGRKARGDDEVKVIADLAAASGRERTALSMMDQPEFADHWAELMTDWLRAAREGGKSQSSCFRANTPAYRDPALARALLTAAPGAALSPAVTPGRPYNLDDVVRSSIAADNLFPVYRTYLFAMTARPVQGADILEANQRADLGQTFNTVFINRQLVCTQCHSSTSSTTGIPASLTDYDVVPMASSFETAVVRRSNPAEVVAWNRTHPVDGDFESALFGAGYRTDPDGKQVKLDAWFRTDQTSGGAAPWGLTGCGSFRSSVPATYTDGDESITVEAMLGDRTSATPTVFGLDGLLTAGYRNLDPSSGHPGGLARVSTASDSAACTACADCAGAPTTVSLSESQLDEERQVIDVFRSSSCRGCHSGPGASAGVDFMAERWKDALVRVPSSHGPSGKLRVAPGRSADSFLHDQVSFTAGSWNMPFGASAQVPGLATKVRNWVDHMPTNAGCATRCTGTVASCEQSTVPNTDVFAYLVAQSAVSRIWNETMGAPLVLAHNFPRNQGQKYTLKGLTEEVFLPNHWSLKKTVARIVSSTSFNREAPAAPGSAEPHQVPLTLDAWTQEDLRNRLLTDAAFDPTRQPQQNNNSAGDGVFRYQAVTVQRSVALGLGWPLPQRFPGGFPGTGIPAWGSRDLQRTLGQYLTDAEPGGRGYDFQTALTWEASIANCAKPSSVTQDWVDLLLDDAAMRGVPFHEVVRSLKARLVNDPTAIGSAERTALGSLVGASMLTTVVTTANKASMRDAARQVCGVVASSPQFLLNGFSLTGRGALPATWARLPGEPVDYVATCNQYVSSYAAASMTLLCSASGLSIGSSPPVVIDLSRICRRGLCERFIRPQLHRCIIDPASCFRIPPIRDPRCLSCPPENFAPEHSVLVAYADLAQVKMASGIRVLRAKSNQWQTLKAGDVMAEGDLIELPAYSKLELSTQLGSLVTDPNGMPKHPLGVSWLMQVTGPSYVDSKQPKPPKVDGPLAEPTQVHGGYASWPAPTMRAKGAPVPQTVEVAVKQPQNAQRFDGKDLVKLEVSYGQFSQPELMWLAVPYGTNDEKPSASPIVVGMGQTASFTPNQVPGLLDSKQCGMKIGQKVKLVVSAREQHLSGSAEQVIYVTCK